MCVQQNVVSEFLSLKRVDGGVGEETLPLWVGVVHITWELGRNAESGPGL